ncbi:ash family protein [Aeromonas veronii]
MKKQYGLTAQGEALPKSQEVGLFLNVQRGTIRPAAAKSAAGRRNPNTTIAPLHALAWFFVGTRAPSLEAALLHLLGSLRSVMVARAGQPKGWPVSIVAGIPTPARATTMSVGTLVGSEDLSTIEAATMATVPTQALSSRLRSLIAHPCHSAALWRLCTPPPCCMTTYRVTPPDGGLIV